MTARPVLLTEDAEVGPPRRNGELVFEAPWEGRAFGLAVALAEQGRFEWATFRALLVEETAAADRIEGAGGVAPSYYARWSRALERLLDLLGELGPGELDAAVAAGAGAPPDHGPGLTGPPGPPDR